MLKKYEDMKTLRGKRDSASPRGEHFSPECETSRMEARSINVINFFEHNPDYSFINHLNKTSGFWQMGTKPTVSCECPNVKGQSICELNFKTAMFWHGNTQVIEFYSYKYENTL